MSDREHHDRNWHRAHPDLGGDTDGETPDGTAGDHDPASGSAPWQGIPGFDPRAESLRADRFRLFLNDLDDAKGHFRESQRHLLLGLGEVARVTSTHLTDLSTSVPTVRIAEGMTTLLHSVLELAAARIPPLEADGDLRLDARLEALANLRALLRAEIERHAGQPDHQLKADALQAIIDAITREMERVAHQADSQGPGQPPASRRTRGQTEKINIQFNAAPSANRGSSS